MILLLEHLALTIMASFFFILALAYSKDEKTLTAMLLLAMALGLTFIIHIIIWSLMSYPKIFAFFMAGVITIVITNEHN